MSVDFICYVKTIIVFYKFYDFINHASCPNSFLFNGHQSTSNLWLLQKVSLPYLGQRKTN